MKGLNQKFGGPRHLLNKPSYLKELIFNLRCQIDTQSPRSNWGHRWNASSNLGITRPFACCHRSP